MIEVGQNVPDVELFVLSDGAPLKVSSRELFGARHIALFGVPGAFTRTCSAKHLPGFINRAEELGDAGVDEIYCLSSNDVFVLDAWATAFNAEGKVTMLSDGLFNFSDAAGLSVELPDNGFGKRCRRFSMCINHGRVTHFFVEPPGEFGQTSAETLLSVLTPKQSL